MLETYTVAVSSATALTCHQRIELEVRFARELERLLGGDQEVVAACDAALRAQNPLTDWQRWTRAKADATLAVRQDADLPDLEFHVRLDQPAGRGASS